MILCVSYAYALFYAFMHTLTWFKCDYEFPFVLSIGMILLLRCLLSCWLICIITFSCCFDGMFFHLTALLPCIMLLNFLQALTKHISISFFVFCHSADLTACLILLLYFFYFACNFTKLWFLSCFEKQHLRRNVQLPLSCSSTFPAPSFY